MFSNPKAEIFSPKKKVANVKSSPAKLSTCNGHSHASDNVFIEETDKQTMNPNTIFSPRKKPVQGLRNGSRDGDEGNGNDVTLEGLPPVQPRCNSALDTTMDTLDHSFTGVGEHEMGKNV